MLLLLEFGGRNGRIVELHTYIHTYIPTYLLTYLADNRTPYNVAHLKTLAVFGSDICVWEILSRYCFLLQIIAPIVSSALDTR